MHISCIWISQFAVNRPHHHRIWRLSMFCCSTWNRILVIVRPMNEQSIKNIEPNCTRSHTQSITPDIHSVNMPHSIRTQAPDQCIKIYFPASLRYIGAVIMISCHAIRHRSNNNNRIIYLFYFVLLFFFLQLVEITSFVTGKICA